MEDASRAAAAGVAAGMVGLAVAGPVIGTVAAAGAVYATYVEARCVGFVCFCSCVQCVSSLLG